MFDFKKELAKFQPLPELEELQGDVNDNNIEDIMDILKTFANNNKNKR